MAVSRDDAMSGRRAGVLADQLGGGAWARGEAASEQRCCEGGRKVETDVRGKTRW